jgi:hypothetical protein
LEYPAHGYPDRSAQNDLRRLGNPLCHTLPNRYNWEPQVTYRFEERNNVLVQNLFGCLRKSDFTLDVHAAAVPVLHQPSCASWR